MTTQYKRKFLVPGDTIKTCWDYRKQCDEKYGTYYKSGTAYFNKSKPCYSSSIPPFHDESNCPYPINKPIEYIVSETEDGEWQCSCKAWTTHKPRQDCKHIIKAKANPEKYEIAVDWTSKSVETMKKVTG